MRPSDAPDDPDLARFREIIAGLDPDDLPTVLDRLRDAAPGSTARAARPDRRRPLPPTRQVVMVRVDLHDATPPIWRRLELRSDLSLENLHDVLLVAFGWAGFHLWRFSAGGSPFAPGSQQFLCEYDVEEGEDDGIPAGEARLGELLQERGDSIESLYDYGDNWDLGILVESVREAERGAAPARAIGGRRAAPPEDCGGLRDAEHLAEVLEDPAFFDLAELDRQLWAGPPAPVDPPLGDPSATDGVPAVLVEPLRALRGSAAGQDLAQRAALLAPDRDEPGETEWERALRAVTWFLEQADRDGGIPLTGAGYLRPAVVEAASAVVPAMTEWIGAKNREVQSAPLLYFRESLQQAGILRKYKGALLPTRPARAAFRAGTVRALLAESLIPAPGGFDHVASALLLTHVATTKPGLEVSVQAITAAVTELGWHVDRGPVPGSVIQELPSRHLLSNIGDRTGPRKHHWMTFSPEAAALARQALGS